MLFKLKGLVIDLEVTERAPLSAPLSSNSQSDRSGRETGSTAITNTGKTAQIIELIPLPYPDIASQVNHGDHRTISHPITRLRARRTVTQENFTAACEARKATLRKQPVVNSDALLDAGVTPKIVPAIDPGWVALNRDLAP
ncbi:hypothetical protein [Pseudomonas aeruginosa]|uniref:hypothetical protein n=1 Tax=Pseudomonas aeruginosa TaxID=287 RepID=UPI0021C56A44|nr:hypothetical protein [Pseudomonas aeruginosa]